VLRLVSLGDGADARALVARGLFESRRDAEAISAAEAILRDEPDHYQTRYLLGQIYVARGEVWRAMLEFGRVLRTHRRHRDTLRALGDLHFMLGAFVAAAKCYRRLLAEDSRDASAWLRVAASDFATGRDLDAMDAFRRATRFDPSLSEWGHSLGDYYSLLRTLRPRSGKGSDER
jgi:tetratricopeptide (TPR) repeat protein